MIVQQNMIASASTRQAIGSLMQSQNSAASSAPVSLNPIPNNIVNTAKINNKQIIMFSPSLVYPIDFAECNCSCYGYSL